MECTLLNTSFDRKVVAGDAYLTVDYKCHVSDGVAL